MSMPVSALFSCMRISVRAAVTRTMSPPSLPSAFDEPSYADVVAAVLKKGSFLTRPDMAPKPSMAEGVV